MAFGALKGTLTVALTNITNPTSATGSVSVAIGDLIFGVFSEVTNITVTSVTDNLHTPTTYTAQTGTDAGTATGQSFYMVATAAGTLTSVSGTATAGGDNVVFSVAVIEGPFTTPPIDAAPANITTDVTSPFTCPATGILAQTDEVVICWAANNGTTALAATSPNLLAIDGNVAGAIPNLSIGYQLVAATTSIAPAFTSAANPAQQVLGTASFKSSAGAPADVLLGTRLLFM